MSENKKPNDRQNEILQKIKKIQKAIKAKLKAMFLGVKTMELGNRVGIDLGTATVLVFVEGKGIVLQEPAVVAMDKNTGKILKVGTPAQQMLGRTPGHIVAVRPMKEGVINQYETTLKMLQYFVKKACGTMYFPPKVLICIPSGISEVEKRAVIDASREAGAQKTYLIEEPIAAAIGTGIDIHNATGNIIMDIGGGTTDIAVICLGGIVKSKSIKTAGDKFDEAIIRYIRRKHHLVIGETAAQELKIAIGCVYPPKKEKTVTVKGRDENKGTPEQITVTSTEMAEALKAPVTEMMDALSEVIEDTPADLLGDLIQNGVILTGGGAKIAGLTELIHQVTNLKATVADEPEKCVALGTGKMLDSMDSMLEGIESPIIGADL